MATAAVPRTAARKPRMRRIGDGRYLVESTSRPGIGHQVDVRRGRCSCKAGQFGRRCHHLFLSEQFEDWYRGQRALAPEPQIVHPNGMRALLEAFA